MRNDDNSAAEGPPDNGPGAAYASGISRPSRRRRAIVGAVGLAMILGAGAYVATQQLTDGAQTTTRDARAPAPMATNASPLASPTPSVAPTSSAASSGSSKSAATMPPTAPTAQQPRTVAERIAAARAAAKRDGVEVQRALPPKNVAPIAAADKLTVTETGTLKKDRETLRVVSARQDLTGQRELAWVADKGESFGDATCTQKIRLSNDAEAQVRPTLLLCFRTSATKSVYTVAVDLDGKPSKADSVAAIDRQWAKMS